MSRTPTRKTNAKATIHSGSGPWATSRRTFLSGAGVAGLSAFLPLSHAQSQRSPASRRVNIAAIGAGGMGAGNMSALVGENIVAFADPDPERVRRSLLDRDGRVRAEREALKAAYDKAERFTDYRRMFDTRKDIEAVLIATPDHHHAIAAKMAMERGLHVYVQKPLSWSVRESRVLQGLAKDNPRLVTQMGNQGHSGDDGRRVVELIRGGAIGTVRDVHAWTNRPVWPQGGGRPSAQATPASLDWDLWLGPADVDWGYHPDYAHFNWRGWLPFGSGALGDMGAHLLDFPVWALRLGLPTRVETRNSRWGGDTDPWDNAPPKTLQSYPLASMTTFEFDDARPHPVRITWYDGGLTPARPASLHPSIRLNPEGGVMYIGDKGILIHETYGEKPVLMSAAALAECASTEACAGSSLEDVNREETARWRALPASLPRVVGGRGGHEMNWVRAIRGEEEISSPFSVAAPLNETMALGMVAMRAGEAIRYDGRTGRITSSQAANALLDRTYRKGWEL